MFNSKKHNQELNLNDIYKFLEMYSKKKFHNDFNSMKPSEIASYKKNILIDYGMGNEITNENILENIKILFKLAQKGFIFIYIKDYYTRNKNLKSLMEKNRRRESDFGGIRIIPKKYKYSFLDKIFGPKSYDPHEGINFYINDLLNLHLDNFLDNLELGTDFNMLVFDNFSFTDSVLRYINDNQNEDDKNNQINELYNEIKKIVGESKNYGGDIILSYPIKNYNNTKGYYYWILYKLYETENINFKEVYIKETYVTFIINKIVDFDKTLFNKLLSEKKSYLKDEILYISTEQIPVNKKWKGEINQYYELLDLIYKSQKEFGNQFSYIQMETIRNSQKYIKINKIPLKYELFYNSLKDLHKKIKNKGFGKNFYGVNGIGINIKF